MGLTNCWQCNELLVLPALAPQAIHRALRKGEKCNYCVRQLHTSAQVCGRQLVLNHRTPILLSKAEDTGTSIIFVFKQVVYGHD